MALKCEQSLGSSEAVVLTHAASTSSRSASSGAAMARPAPGDGPESAADTCRFRKIAFDFTAAVKDLFLMLFCDPEPEILMPRAQS